MTELNLPADLIAFLRAGRQLQYDPATCEAGVVTLLPVEDLKVELFPMECQSTDVADEDPHRDGEGCYLVEGVNVVAASTGEYDPIGLLLWLPRDGLYGSWDGSHSVILAFPPDVSWTKIAQAPARYINAQWQDVFDDSAPIACLKPWTLHPYNAEPVPGPPPDLAEWYEANWTLRGKYEGETRIRTPEQIQIRLVLDGDHCQIAARQMEMDSALVWQSQPEQVRTLTDAEWAETRQSLDAGFWRQPKKAAGTHPGEELTAWVMAGFCGRRYHVTRRSFAAGCDRGDAVHELGARLTTLARISRFEDER
jgi:hypothetical protein